MERGDIADFLPEGIHKRLVNGTMRYIAQIRLNGKRISRTFSLVESAIYWLKDKQTKRGDNEPKENILVTVFPKPKDKFKPSTPRQTFDELTDIFVNNHQELPDHEFMNIYWALGENWRKPCHTARYKQIMLSQRKELKECN